MVALARLRWNIFLNSLQTLRGRLELVSRFFVFLALVAGGLGAGGGLAVAAFYFVQNGKPQLLGLLFWAVFFVWQLFPLLAAAFSPQFEFESLLRFPLRFRSFFLISLFYGLLEPGAVGGCWFLLCITAGISRARPALFGWAATTSFVFALMNLLLARALMTWLEKWLAQRKTREILGGVFFILLMSVQLTSSALAHQHLRNAHPPAWWVWARPAVTLLPPTLAGRAMTSAYYGRFSAASFIAIDAVLAAVLGWLLAVRLRSQYRGESLTETSAPVAAARSIRIASRSAAPARTDFLSRLVPAPVAAVCGKELRYFLRSGPMLFNFALPLFFLLLFKVMPAQSDARFTARFTTFAFPVGAAYGLLFLGNIMNNCFGIEGRGFQFLLFAPVSFREILLGKNLAYIAVMAVQICVLWLGVAFLFRPPGALILALTTSGLLFALPINFACGNLLSLYFPKKLDLAMFGRQRASVATALLSLLIQGICVGVIAVTIVTAKFAGRLWLACVAFLLFAAGATAAYFRVVEHCSRLALDRREVLTAEICRE